MRLRNQVEGRNSAGPIWSATHWNNWEYFAISLKFDRVERSGIAMRLHFYTDKCRT